ncbi:GNAT family N-acetyltransferase [Vallitalea okinawensis]|uniref:GNAT family N-acetyltransferase n=1 Tax=Vallitalea okinawensis TaxID=2078660 RepID=UPI000CFD96F7|nr:GNAT family protein [Vallitalea okinawensis]
MYIDFRKPSKEDAKDIAEWKYEGIYSFYDNDKTEAKQQWARNIHHEENTFALYNENKELIGNCCFDFDEEEGIIFGVQMRPDLTGKGMGTDLIKIILDFGKEKYQYDEIKLYVAKFNRRAIRVYEKLGFVVNEEFLWHVNGEEREFIGMFKRF